MISKFQIITLSIFIICIIAGVAAFALYKGNTQSTSLPSITMWGTFPATTFNQYVSNLNNGLANQVNITYTQKKPDAFSQDFVNALAVGRGPDAVLIPADMILSEENKLVSIPYSAFPERNFIETYIQEAGVYLTKDGIEAIPFTLDPLVMYWNRDTFNAAGIATYPRFWDEFTGDDQQPGLVQKLRVKDQNQNIRKAALAMGDFTNMTNAREILGSLLLQIRNPVTIRANDGIVSALKTGVSYNPLAALQFFTRFIDPSGVNYSWNRGMANDKTAFLGGTLATYFGFASELNEMRAKNPNLNFDVAPLPQIRTGGQKAAYGKMYGFSLVRAGGNPNAAYQIISILTSPQNLANLSKTMYLPPVRIDLIQQGSTDPSVTIFNQAALISKTWLDADPSKSRRVFNMLVESLTSGQKSMNEEIQDTGDEYDAILRQAMQ